ncbi:hypothetical protein pipiens_013508 [Culex pipiens pipiens]|uniref:Uncharacterized protein n=1 Tax=Culex pipiens pipiens TaxID=38569 RepID=A0ABD1CZB7_CULPP
MLRSPSWTTFFQSRRPDMPSFSRQWFVCFPASPCFGISSAFRKVILPAVARVPKSRPPGSGGPSSLYGGLPVELWLRGLLPPRHLQLARKQKNLQGAEMQVEAEPLKNVHHVCQYCLAV